MILSLLRLFEVGHQVVLDGLAGGLRAEAHLRHHQPLIVKVQLQLDEAADPLGQGQGDVLSLTRDRQLFVYNFDVLWMVSEAVGTKIGKHLAKRLNAQIQLAVCRECHGFELLALAKLKCDGQGPVFVVPANPSMS